MNRNLFSKELKNYRISFLLWLAAITLLISGTLSVYRTFFDNQSKVMGMLNLIPKGALQFKGISNISDLLSVLGFYAANNVIYMMVLGSIFSIVLSSNILLKEEYNKTAEYLLTRPLTRSGIFFSKLAVIVVYVFMLNLVTAWVGYFVMELVKNGPVNFNSFLVLSLYTFLLNLLFGALGLFLSTLVKRPKSITTFCIGLVLVFYFIYTFSKITERYSGIGYISPFRFVNLDVISEDYALNPWNLLYFAGLSLVLTGLSYRIYNRKDIYL